MKKKHSPNKTSRENQNLKAQRGSIEAINHNRCLDPAIVALRKVSNVNRPPTPYSEVENGKSSGQVLGPVFVPNKFMNGGQSYVPYARAMPSASWSSNRSPGISKVEAKQSNLSEVYRISKDDVTLRSLSVVDKKPPLKLSNEEFKTTIRASFLPKIDGNSKTNSGSFQSIVCDCELKRSPQTSSETIKLPPAKIRNKNITCTREKSSFLEKNTIKNSSPEDVQATGGLVPKPPSVSCSKERSARRKTRRPKD